MENLIVKTLFISLLLGALVRFIFLNLCCAFCFLLLVSFCCARGLYVDVLNILRIMVRRYAV